MYSFHVSLHVRPRVEPIQQAIVLRGKQVTVQQFTSHLSEPFVITFEQAEAALGKLERMFCEPDGSFVWVASRDPGWQVDGQLYDRNHRLLYVELKGTCTPECFDQLLAAFGWPEVPLVFQLVREAVLLNEGSFRRYAEQA